MRLKINENSHKGHKDLVSCVGWSSGEEVYSCGDDHTLLRWNVGTGESSVVMQLPENFFATNMHFYPRSGDGATGKKGGSDVLAMCTSDGKIHFVVRSGRIEKTVEAHTGAVLCVRWSPDGQALVSGGEDGLVKVWSRSGMLRSSLAQNPVPVYCGAWGATSEQVLFSSGKQLVIKSLQANIKPIFWKAHDGVILCVDWNVITGLIVSGGEDCKYRVWNGYGSVLYSGAAHDYPITSVSWSPDGNMFAVGGYDTLRLCDKNGWSYSLDKPQCGSVMALSWSVDSTQLAAASASGKVIFAHVTNLRLEWHEYSAILIDDRHVTVHNLSENAVEKLEFRDRAIKMSFKYGHLIVATSSSCYIYSTRNWNTPVIIDLKESRVTLIIQSEKSFLLVDGGSVLVYSYEGRLMCSPRNVNIQPEVMHVSSCSLSNDTIAVRDKQDDRVVHLFDSSSGKSSGDGKPITHKVGVTDLGLDQIGPSSDRKLALIDKNRDLYLYSVRCYGQSRRCAKLATMVSSICWHDNNPSLCGVSGDRLTVWCYPNVAFVDKQLLSRSTVDKTDRQLGSDPSILSFSANSVTLRKQEGSVVSSLVPPYIAVLHQLLAGNKWNEALSLCRSIRTDCVWSCLAAMSVLNKDLETAQMAYAALNDVDKVEYLESVKSIPAKEARQAEMVLISGNVQDAEAMLVQAGLVFRAIMLHLRMYAWDRALDLAATAAPRYVALVLAHRRRFLARLGREENNKAYLAHEDAQDVPDWDEVKAMLKKEYESEKR